MSSVVGLKLINTSLIFSMIDPEIVDLNVLVEVMVDLLLKLLWGVGGTEAELRNSPALLTLAGGLLRPALIPVYETKKGGRVSPQKWDVWLVITTQG